MSAAQTQSHPIITIAQVGAPKGVQGFLKLNVFTAEPTTVLSFKHYFIKVKQQWQACDEIEFKRVGHDFQIRIDGIADRDQAKQFTQAWIGVSREELPTIETEDEYYWSDLEGLTVVDTQGVELGRVDHVFSTGANDVLSVIGGRKHLIPFIGQYVIEVDLVQSRIIVDWDEDFD